jgi:tRNA(adenine34) deaminase
MCAGAIYQARLSRVVYGTLDPKAGAMGSLYRIHEDTRLNHRLPVEHGILAEECAAVLKDFFRSRR